jgi:hypothetical protein
MKRVVVMGLLVVSAMIGSQALAGDKKSDKKAGGPPAAPQPSCGAMMKSLAPLPAKFSELMTAIADGQAGHAAMLTGKDAATVAEATELKKIMQDHRDMAAMAKKTATEMEAAGSLAPAPNEPKPDAKALDHMMKTVALEKEMAAMMVKDAEETEKRIEKMKGGAAK